jgi:hypothetical protein
MAKSQHDFSDANLLNDDDLALVQGGNGLAVQVHEESPTLDQEKLLELRQLASLEAPIR